MSRRTRGRHFKRIDENLLAKPKKKSRLEKLFDQISNASNNTNNVIIESKQEEKTQEPIEVIQLNPKIKDKITNSKEKDATEDPNYYLMSDNILASVFEHRDILDSFIKSKKEALKQFDHCTKKIREFDCKIQDFLHELRMPKKNAYEGYKLYKLGHDLEIERQGYKNAWAFLDKYIKYIEYIDGIKVHQEMLESALKHMDRQLEMLDNKIYIPRSDLDLSVRNGFDSLDRQQQEKLLSLRKKGRN